MPPKTPKKTPTRKPVKSIIDIDADGRKQPTAGEALLFYTIIKNMRNKPDIDWAGVAVDNGFKNAETAKVRFGQVRRKLGVDNWATPAGKTKGEGASDDDEAETPVPARTKKGTVTPSTGAGVKKRAGGTSTKRAASSPATGGRARKAKTEAMVKLEEGVDDLFDDIYDDEDDNNDNTGNNDDDDDDDDETADAATPTPTKGKGKAKAKGGKSIKKSGSAIKPKRAAAGVKTEPGSPSPPNHYGLNAEYDNFPEFIPDKVIERKAILINVCGNWTVSPADEATHGQWLARLPGDKQTVFYAQEAEALKAAGKAPTTTRHSAGDNKSLTKNPEAVANNLATTATTTAPSTGTGNNNNNKGFMNDPETVARNLATMTEIQMMSANFRRGLDEMRGVASPALGLMSPLPIPGLDMGMGMGGLGPLNMPVSMGMAASMGYLPGGGTNGGGGGAMTATTASPRLGGFGNGRRSNPQAVVVPGTGFGNGGRRAFVDTLTPPVPGFGHGDGAEMSSFEDEMKQLEQRDQQLLFGSGGCLNDDEEDGY